MFNPVTKDVVKILESYDHNDPIYPLEFTAPLAKLLEDYGYFGSLRYLYNAKDRLTSNKKLAEKSIDFLHNLNPHHSKDWEIKTPIKVHSDIEFIEQYLASEK